MVEVKAENVIVDNLEKGGSATNSKSIEVKADNTTNAVVTQVITREKRHIPSASTALVMGAVLGILQSIILMILAKPLLGIMGVRSVSTSYILAPS